MRKSYNDHMEEGEAIRPSSLFFTHITQPFTSLPVPHAFTTSLLRSLLGGAAVSEVAVSSFLEQPPIRIRNKIQRRAVGIFVDIASPSSCCVWLAAKAARLYIRGSHQSNGQTWHNIKLQQDNEACWKANRVSAHSAAAL